VGGHKERVNMVYFFVFIYENRKMKSVEIILINGGEGKRENNRGGESKIH
jgi:hypothetical protein